MVKDLLCVGAPLKGERVINMARIQLLLEVTVRVPLGDRGLGWGKLLKC